MLPGRQGGSVDQCNPGHPRPGFRPLAKHGILFFASRILHACKHGGFRACGRDQRAFRSPFGNLRIHTLWNACKFGRLRGRFSCNPVKKCLFQPFEPRARMPGVQTVDKAWGLFFASRTLHACKHGGFRACGRDQRAFRSPFGNLRVHTLWNACKFGRLRGRFSCNPVKKCLFNSLNPGR